MTDRTAPSSDARKRRLERDMADAHTTARERDARVFLTGLTMADVRKMQAATTAIEHMASLLRPHSPPAHPITQETDMPDQTRHDELVALLSKISEESVTTSNVLADMLDLLRERLPEPEGAPEPADLTEEPPIGTRIVDRDEYVWERREDEWRVWADRSSTWGARARTFAHLHEHYAPLRLATSADLARVGIDDEPAPADDLPGEPVEPSDLRAGDRIWLTWGTRGVEGVLADELDTLTVRGRGAYLVVVDSLGGWGSGISDVRLIERAPREDEDPDEALAKVIFGDAYGSHEGLRQAQLDVALMAREHVEAEWKPYILREQTAREEAQDRAEKAEADLADERDRHDATIAERDALRERLDALRADLSPGGLIWSVDAALRRDDERAAKEATQR